MTEGLLTQLRSMAAQQSKLRAFRDKVCWGRRAGAGAVGARWVLPRNPLRIVAGLGAAEGEDQVNDSVPSPLAFAES